MSQANADRNLLFGILAVQMDFIKRDQLITAMNAWVLAKATPLGQILLEQGALSRERHALLEALVQEHLKLHDNDPQKSLAAVTSAGPLRDRLQEVTDPDVRASLAQSDSTRLDDEDPYLTRPPSVGTPSSSGLRFHILRPHAEGGLGKVSVARDEELHREVALKEIKPRHADHPESRSRFLLEAEITGGLEHPSIVPVYGLGAYADGRPFYAMRFIRGDSLKDAIERYHQPDGPGSDPRTAGLELRQLLGRFIAVCNAIEYAHSRGILHRDLKPSNIMLGEYGETLVVDWGLAKPLDQPGSMSGTGEKKLTPSSGSAGSYTVMGSAIGTPAYMSPEQAAGRLDILGPASDIYSLGATLYELLTGKVPFPDDEVGTVLQKVQRGDFPRPCQVKKTVPPALEAVCLKAMAVKPAERYGSPRELADDIEHWLADEPVSAWPEPWTVRVRRWVGRHRTLVTATASAVLVAVIGLTVATVLLTAANERERQAKEQARTQRDEARKQKGIAEASAQLARKREREAEQQRQRAERNFVLARRAVDRYHTEVSESVLLKEPGMEPLRKKLLVAAREYYQKFVRDRGKDVAVEEELGRALFRLAQITGEIGSDREAIGLHRQALAIFQKLAGAHPKAAVYQAEAARTLHHMGRLHRLHGRPGEAEKAYQKALAIWERLVKERRQESRYQADLARSLVGLGNVFAVTKRPDRAEFLYLCALRIREQLAAENPKDPRQLRDLAVTHNNLGRVYRQFKEKYEKAKAEYREAIAAQERLVQLDKRLSQYQDDLARSYFRLGELCLLTQEKAAAQTALEKAVALWNTLVDGHPAVPLFQLRLAMAWHMLGTAFVAAGQDEKAVEAFGQAIKFCKDLKELAPSQVGEQKKQLWRAYGKRAETLTRLERYAEALQDWDEAIKVTPPGDQFGVRISRALTLVRSGDHARAAAEAKTLTVTANRRGPALYLLACVYARCCGAAARDSRLTPGDRQVQAGQYAARAVELLEEARTVGYFQTPANRAKLTKEPALESLRSNEQFKKLLGGLG
jgi:serine/threonine-protein kinase